MTTEPDQPADPRDDTTDLESSADTGADDMFDVVPAMPERVGQYRIRRAIASGGMGTVYEAFQENPRRTVAVKVMRQGVVSASALRRFEYEAQILARLRHPGIAQVYEAGTHDDGSGGVPFFAMEYVSGSASITQYAKRADLNTRDRLALFAQVCDAVHHGHQKGIIHRDLKPDNILVDSKGHPKIIDFGVARATDSDLAVTTLQTSVGQLVGTVQYMSPEQVEADPHDLDTRSDVYSLGVVLYQLLTGRLPYEARARSIYEAARIVREGRPAPLSSIDAMLRGDIETIVHKALEKSRTRRYQSADELRADIGRYLEGRAIAARSPSLRYQLGLFAKKNRALVAAITLIVVLLIGGTVGTTVSMFRARRAEQNAAQEAERANAVSDFLSRMLLSADPVLPRRSSWLALSGDAATTYAGEAGREISAVDLLRRATETLDDAFPDAPETEADLRHTLGQTLLSLGQFEDARGQLEHAVDLRRTLFGATHPDVARSSLLLGDTLDRLGDGDEADRIYARAHETFAVSLGPAADETLDAASRRAMALMHRRRTEDALDLQDRTVALAARERGPRDMATLHQMLHRCEMLWIAARFDEAVEDGRAAVAALREVSGAESVETAEGLSILSGPLRQSGRLDEAETAAMEAWRLKVRNLGRENPIALDAARNLADVYGEQGRFEEAVTLYRNVLEEQRRQLAPTHLDLLHTTNNLAVVLGLLQQDLGEAETLARESIAGFERIFGRETQMTLNARDTLALVLRGQGRHDDAIDEYESILEVTERRGLQDSLEINATVGIARCMIDMERYEDAEQRLAAAVAIAAPEGDEDPLRAWGIAHTYVELYEAWGRRDDAATWRRRAGE